MTGLYAETIREEIRKGRMTLEQGLDFMLEHGVHLRIACRLLACSYDEVKDYLPKDTDTAK